MSQSHQALVTAPVFAATLAIAIPNAPAFAEMREIARTIVAGEEVILYADRTWEFSKVAEAAAARCLNSKRVRGTVAPLDFCLARDTWQEVSDDQSGGNFEKRFSARDLGIYGGLISEIGKFSSEFMAEVLIGRLKDAGTVVTSSLDLENVSVFNEHGWQEFEARAILQGIAINYLVFFTTYDEFTVQMLFWTAGDDEIMRREAENVMETMNFRSDMDAELRSLVPK